MLRGRSYQNGERGERGTLPFKLGFAGPVMTLGINHPLL